MIWVQFVISAALIVLAAIQLARFGDAIALRTRLGGMFVGTLLLAAATSLPELLTTINAIGQDVPDLAAGNMFGSSMFNMMLLGLLDIVNWRRRILRRVAMKHALMASLATLLTGMAVFFLLANVEIRIGWVGVDSLLIMAAYLVGVYLLRSNSSAPVVAEPPVVDSKVPGLRQAIIGFLICTVALVIITPWMVSSSSEIARITGLGSGFVGAVLVATVTSLPEVVAVIAATRLGAYDMAVGNLFGSNAFNMFALGLSDFFYLEGRFLGRIDPSFALVGLLALLLTNMGLIGNVARLKRRLVVVEIDALLLVLGYFAGMLLLYRLGIGT